MTGLAADPATLSPDLFLGLLPKPLAVALAIMVGIAWAVAEVTGKLNGPISKLLERRKVRQDRQAVGWRERDARVEELRETVEIVDEQVQLLKDQLGAARTELRLLHRYSDAQNRAIRRHIEWDRLWSQRARDAGIDVPDPPPSLWVEIEEHQEVDT